MGTVQTLDGASVDGSSSRTTLACDQAIFTSVRTPMGEGYRIIAASRGLCAADKQAITVNCPSHEGLCRESSPPDVTEAIPEAVSFHGLPSGRVCVGFCCFAGAEHTGRGGQRIYTHCVVFAETDFVRCGYNAFNVVRAMVAAGLASPKLKPENPLAELHLSVTTAPSDLPELKLNPTLDATCRMRILQGLLDERSMIVDLEDSWLETTEALLLGLPGPMRARVSFCAGAKFSLGRSRRLHLTHDKNGQTRRRIVGQPIDFISPRDGICPDTPESAWSRFVERHWKSGEIGVLAKRTSLAFADVGPSGRESVGTLYNHVDDLPGTATGNVLDLVASHLQPQVSGVEGTLVDYFVGSARAELAKRFVPLAWHDAKLHWPMLTEIYAQSGTGRAFAAPILQQAMRCAMRDDPLDAASVALDLTLREVSTTGTSALGGILDDVLRRLAMWAEAASNVDNDELLRFCKRWQAVRPNCPIIAEIQRTCTTPAESP